MLLMLFDLPGRFIDRMIFLPSSGVDIRPEEMGVPVEEVFLDTEDGVRIHAFFLPAQRASRALLFLHGNAGGGRGTVEYPDGHGRFRSWRARRDR